MAVREMIEQMAESKNTELFFKKIGTLRPYAF
jgi:hypothetical protein